MLLELGIGDAYGIAYEFADGPAGRNDVRAYHHNPKHPELGGGRYTDDTQRAIANAEVLLGEEGGMVCDYQRAYLKVFKRDPRPGYSGKYYEFLQQTPDQETFARTIRPGKSTNGAIMGVPPLGYIRDRHRLREESYLQAMATHSPRTFECAEAVALMAHYFIYDIGPKDELADYLNAESTVFTDWRSEIAIIRRTSMEALDTVRNVFYVIQDSDDLARMLWRSVFIGGDTDTVAALVMAIASCSKEVDQNLPQTLHDGLERGPYGYDFLVDLDKQLTKCDYI